MDRSREALAPPHSFLAFVQQAYAPLKDVICDRPGLQECRCGHCAFVCFAATEDEACSATCDHIARCHPGKAQ